MATMQSTDHTDDPRPLIGRPAASTTARPPLATRPDASRLSRVLRSPLGVATIIGLAILIAATILGPVIWGAQSTVTDVTQLSAKPSAAHPFGTDAAGRDVFARVMTATRLSVVMALAATAIGVTLGIVVGFLPSVLPRPAAAFIVSGTGIALAFPSLLLAIVLSISVGASSLGAVLAIGFAMIPFFARLAQTMSASIAGRDFVSAARILGVPRWRILVRHILPNVREPLIVNASIGAGGSLIAFAGLSFLGLGVQAPETDWGRMLNEGLAKIYVNPATALAPGAAVIFAGVVFTLLGETLSRAFGIDSLGSRRQRSSAPRPGAGTTAAERPEAAIDAVLSVRDLRVAAPAGDGWTAARRRCRLRHRPGRDRRTRRRVRLRQVPHLPGRRSTPRGSAPRHGRSSAFRRH
ncbi:MAG TPA: ABC transporter permease [Plantibacter sp.]|uniref:ABC transporter permease n=1 Tax=unclassified Plantibacter TaxID=2624265 RepID=UPI002BA6F5CF|nr:ABC transporter permease [Plantibacter sp.]